MGYRIRKVQKYHTAIKDQPGAVYQILDTLADRGVNLPAFSEIPVGPGTTQLTIFPDDSTALE